MTESEMLALAEEEGFRAAMIDTSEIEFDPRFRDFCAENLCGKYGANYACPPDCGTPEEMRRRLSAHPRAMVFRSVWPLPDLQDSAAIREAKRGHNLAMLRVVDRLRAAGCGGVMAGASNCILCARCAILDGKPCPFPDRRFSCLSAYCVFVRKLAERCGMDYVAEPGHVALFGLYSWGSAP